MKTAIIARALGKEVISGGSPLPILTDLNLEVASGERVAIIGRSGSGKTTLLSLLAGLDLPTAGELWLDGTRLDVLDEDGRAALRAGRVGFVFQSFQLLNGFTARENVLLPLELAGAKDASRRAEAALTQVGLAHRLRHYPTQLSGGEQQRVALARAFASRPKILFADEPTGNLDTTTGEEIIEQLFALNRDHGATLVLVTHDATLAQRCDRVLTLQQGRLEASPRHD